MKERNVTSKGVEIMNRQINKIIPEKNKNNKTKPENLMKKEYLESYNELTKSIREHQKTWEREQFDTSPIDQKTCSHDAKVKMAGFRNRHECTRCHKFILYDQKTS